MNDNQTKEEVGEENNNNEEESDNSVDVNTEGDSVDLASSEYVVNCSLFSVDKLNNYPTYGSAIDDIEDSMETMSDFAVPSGLEDFDLLTIDAWSVVLDFAKSQNRDDVFDNSATDLQLAMQLFNSANEQITAEARGILTDAGCIGVK